LERQVQHMTEYLYATERHALAEGRVFRNPRHFHAPEHNASKVYIVGDHPKVAKAYRANGVEVVEVGKVEPQIPPTLLCGSDDEGQVSNRDWDALPDDWRDLPWQELRALAKDAGAWWVINRGQAVKAIEDRLAE
jgi:hypothetical protein